MSVLINMTDKTVLLLPNIVLVLHLFGKVFCSILPFKIKIYECVFLDNLRYEMDFVFCACVKKSVGFFMIDVI